jgi:TDG/mug DNA glycosylase family protein
MTSRVSANRPDGADLLAACERTVPDLVGPGLTVLFCGINPGRYSGATGFHFAGPGNRFWKVLYQAGFTDRELRPDESGALPGLGIGITNLVARTTASASELDRADYAGGAERLRQLVAERRPSVVAILGIGAYRLAFDPKASLGRQVGDPTGAVTFVLPNPSGLQARYQLEDLVAMFGEVLAAVPEDRWPGERSDLRA